jgi:hypothetical protein
MPASGPLQFADNDSGHDRADRYSIALPVHSASLKYIANVLHQGVKIEEPTSFFLTEPVHMLHCSNRQRCVGAAWWSNYRQEKSKFCIAKNDGFGILNLRSVCAKERNG